MEHVAILNPRLAKIEDIISGKKTIESRWYRNKINPWNNIKENEKIYFKKSGGSIEAVARVNKIIQLDNPSKGVLKEYVEKYKGEGYINLNMTTSEILGWAEGKRYIIFIFLSDVKKLTPFDIDKSGFGNAVAWLSVNNINDIKK